MSLVRLRLDRNNNMGPACLETISTLSSLKTLDLVDVPLGESKKEFYECLNKLDNLEKLELRRTGIRMEDMKEFHREHPKCELKLGLEEEIMDNYR